MMRAAGYSDTKTFFKAVEAGKIMADDVLPKFGKELQKMAKEGGALDAVMGKTQAQFTRFMNSLTEAKLTLYNNGLDDGLAYSFGALSDIIIDMAPALEALGQFARGAMSALVGVFKVLTVPLRMVTSIVGSFGEALKMLGVEDGTGLIWRLVGAGGALYLMATRFKWVTSAVVALNAQLIIMMARLAPFIAAYGAIEDVAMYAKYGDNANTLTGLAINKTKSMSVGQGLNNLAYGYAKYSPLGWLGLTPEVKLSVNDSEFSKVFDAKMSNSAQAKSAVTQAETAQ